jgi:hypothetical protein
LLFGLGLSYNCDLKWVFSEVKVHNFRKKKSSAVVLRGESISVGKENLLLFSEVKVISVEKELLLLF